MPETNKELSAKIDALERSLAENSADTKAMRAMMTGNGTPENGIAARVIRLDERVPADLKAQLAEIRQNQGTMKWFWQTAFGAFLGGIGVYLSSLLFHK